MQSQGDTQAFPSHTASAGQSGYVADTLHSGVKGAQLPATGWLQLGSRNRNGFLFPNCSRRQIHTPFPAIQLARPRVGPRHHRNTGNSHTRLSLAYTRNPGGKGVATSLSASAHPRDRCMCPFQTPSGQEKKSEKSIAEKRQSGLHCSSPSNSGGGVAYYSGAPSGESL